jgi:enoyl-CoA hydratase/carnithine racemase
VTKQSEEVIVEHRDAIAIVTLNRPKAINAFNDAIRNAIPEIFRTLNEDEQTAAIVLTGAGDRGFCVGADIKEPRDSLSALEHRRRLMPLSWIESLDRTEKPVIAALHGYCLGGGLELAMACDIRIAARNTQLGLPETTLGLIPGGGGTQRLPRLIGLSRALDMLITGDRISAEEAHRIGLITRLVETREDCLTEAVSLAERIAKLPRTAVTYTKEAARSGINMDFASGLTLEKTLFSLLTTTRERAEAAAVFREKWTDK